MVGGLAAVEMTVEAPTLPSVSWSTPLVGTGQVVSCGSQYTWVLITPGLDRGHVAY